MIYLITNIINSLAFTIRSAFLVISLMGQVIVTFISTLLSVVLSACTSVIAFFRIIYEDNSFIFTEELPNFANNAITGCVEQWDYIRSCLAYVSDYVYRRSSFAANAATSSAGAAGTVIIELLFLLKKCAIFCGDTLWLLITFIPVQVPLLLKTVFIYVKDIIVSYVVDSYMVLLKLTNFLTDVPLESCVGITSAIVIVRLCIHFRDDIQSHLTLLYWLVVRKVMYLYHSAYNYITDSEVRVITNMARGQEVDRAEASPAAVDEDPVDPADALCVICQVRQKCVLILPCRHVCLCRDCCLRLYGYQRTCPICRTFIYHSVNIYL